VGIIENRWRTSVTRREALLSLAGILAGAPLLYGQQDPRPLKDHKRVPGLDEMVTAFDFEPLCFANMTRASYDYMAHGADSEFTLRRNRQAFEWVELIERPGATPAAVDTARELLGLKLAVPILVAPSTRQRDLHPDGDAGTYQGATAASKTPMIIASGSSIQIDKIPQADGQRWSQFYPIQDLALSREQIERFQGAGARAIVVTVDQQTSVYERPPPGARRRPTCVGRQSIASIRGVSGTRGNTSTRSGRSSKGRC
jgi:hypothetical protein